jgi:hypothetical protein
MALDFPSVAERIEMFYTLWKRIDEQSRENETLSFSQYRAS